MEERIIAELQALFAGESSGHDLFHTLRVTRTAQRIASQLPCDRELVTLGALLHDADDPKLFATQDYANARRILAGCGVPQERIEAVIAIIRTVSFKGTDSVRPDSLEGQIVQDADRLDAIAPLAWRGVCLWRRQGTQDVRPCRAAPAEHGRSRLPRQPGHDGQSLL